MERYKDILTPCVLSMVEDQFGDDDCLYQHDGAPCHKARSVRGWFVDNKVPEIDCPAQSPGVNPIEHLWDELERQLRSRPAAATCSRWLLARGHYILKMKAIFSSETLVHT
jgi:hypothetical protein